MLLINAGQNPIVVQTRAGNTINVCQCATVYGIFQLADAEDHAKHRFAEPRTGLSGYYNCHGLVFASRRAAIDDFSQIARILKEDGYEVVQPEDLMPGDIAIYYDDTSGEAVHSAFVVSVPHPADPVKPPISVVSKWGNGREYLHKINDCKYSERSTIAFLRIRG